MIQQCAFRIGVRVGGNSAIAASRQQLQQHHQQKRFFSTPTAVKKLAAIVMGAPGWLHFLFVSITVSLSRVRLSSPCVSLQSLIRCVEVLTKKSPTTPFLSCTERSSGVAFDTSPRWTRVHPNSDVD